MSRTDLDPSTLARSLRRMAGDGSIEWVMEPIQASVLLDVADALAENAKLREQYETVFADYRSEVAKLRELARDIWIQARLLDANKHIDGLRITNERYEELESRMRDCGVSV